MAGGGPRRVVVVGGGLAGLGTLEHLRRLGYSGDLTLVGAEHRPPYDRPPLSKRVMAGDLDDTTLRADLSSLDARLLLGETATVLGNRVLHTDRGEYPFDAVVIATGATPVRLPGNGGQRLLRTIDDALALRERLVPGVRLAIIGAGWIGAEVATAAARRGCRVVVVESGQTPLATAVGPEVGGQTLAWYDEAGVELRVSSTVRSVEPAGLLLGGGDFVAADVVLTAVGVRPAVGWLAGSPVTLDERVGGVAVDGRMRADPPGVFAVGDCAAFWSGRFGRRLRFEHWDVALRAPEIVARNLLGDDAVYDPVPYFWSEQFGRMVQYVGDHRASDLRGGGALVWRGDPRGPEWSVCWLADERLVALLAVARPRDIAQGRRLIESAAPVDAERLADPEVRVRDCAKE